MLRREGEGKAPEGGTAEKTKGREVPMGRGSHPTQTDLTKALAKRGALRAQLVWSPPPVEVSKACPLPASVTAGGYPRKSRTSAGPDRKPEAQSTTLLCLGGKWWGSIRGNSRASSPPASLTFTFLGELPLSLSKASHFPDPHLLPFPWKSLDSPHSVKYHILDLFKKKWPLGSFLHWSLIDMYHFEGYLFL